MNFIITAIVFIIIMGIIVFVHELGHFLAAKKFKVYCAEFAIGMGPKLFSKQGKETLYTLRALPIGGFVSMAGEEENQEGMENVPVERSLKGIKTYQKVIIMIAGIVMNLLLAFIIFTGIYLYQREATVEGPLNIVTVAENSNAAKIGLQPNDKITKITLENGKEVTITDTNEALTYLIADHVKEISVQRDDKIVNLNFYYPDMENKLEGISISNNKVAIQWYEAPGFALKKMGKDSTIIFRTLGNLIRGIGVKHLSGPIGIFNVVGTATQAGFLSIVLLLAVLSLNIGLFNLIPIPALDGGRIVLAILEKVLGKYYNKKIETFLIIFSFVLLLALIIFVSFNDIMRIFQ